MNPRVPRLTRRAFLWTSLTSGISFVLAACGLRPNENQAPAATPMPASPVPPTQPAPTVAAPTEAPRTQPAVTQAALAPTPACGDDDGPTPAQTEGPFYTPSSPERTSFLEPGIAGTPIVLSGRVLSTGCQPVAGALVDFWHADDAGVYDNEGFRLRGHQFTDEQGRYSLETIVPGLYPGRTRHFHVKVQAANQPVLTTQLYFPDEPANNTDRIFHPALLIDVHAAADGKQASFDFVLAIPG